jgi:hypothetical protein
MISQFILDNPDIDTDDIQLNVDELLNDARDTNAHLQGKTLNDVNAELFDAVGQDEAIYEKLKNRYRLVNDINDLHTGKYIRWLSLKVDDNGEDTLILKPGGLVVSITESSESNGNKNQIMCRIGKYIISVKYDDTIVFQKLSFQELMVLDIGTG